MDNESNNLHEMYQRRIAAMEEFGGLRSRILYVLNDGSKNGIEIMDAIQGTNRDREPFGRWPGHRDPRQPGPDMRGPGAWRPSPGSIYPMLGKMAAAGLINKKDDGRYELTKTGHEAFDQIFGQPVSRADSLERGPYSLENVLREMDGYASYLEDVKKEKLASHADEIDAIIDKLARVRESLRHESDA